MELKAVTAQRSQGRLMKVFHITVLNKILIYQQTQEVTVASTTVSIIKLIRMEKSQNKAKISDRKTAFLNYTVSSL